MTTTYPIFNMNAERYLYGPQVVRNELYNLLRPFPQDIWLMILFSLVATILLFLLIHETYKKLPEGSGLIAKQFGNADLALKTLGTLTEPDRLTFFPSASTGIVSLIKNDYRN